MRAGFRKIGPLEAGPPHLPRLIGVVVIVVLAIEQALLARVVAIGAFYVRGCAESDTAATLASVLGRGSVERSVIGVVHGSQRDNDTNNAMRMVDLETALCECFVYAVCQVSRLVAVLRIDRVMNHVP